MASFPINGRFLLSVVISIRVDGEVLEDERRNIRSLIIEIVGGAEEATNAINIAMERMMVEAVKRRHSTNFGVMKAKIVSHSLTPIFMS